VARRSSFGVHCIARKDMDQSILDRRTPSHYCSNVQRYVIDIVLVFLR
jgi:hypothetical protein